MSPKSRGRPAGRGKPKRKRLDPARALFPADRMMSDTRSVAQLDDVLDVERWVSGWLGQEWVTAPLGEREPEHDLCMGVVGRACTRPSPHGVVAVAALRRVVPDTEHRMLDETLAILAETQPMPAWIGASGWTPVAAWRAVDVWESERVLFVEFDGPQPHTLMAQVYTVGGILVDRLGLLRAGAASLWDEFRDGDEVPMPLTAQPVEEVLAEFADALRCTDTTWPRQDDPDVVELRALAWARCRAYLPAVSDWEPLEDEQRQRLVEDFVAVGGVPVDEVTRSLADLFLDYGDGYITAGPLCWSPGTVGLFLADWLPRKAVLDAQQRAALLETLRGWLRFVLNRRGVDVEWIEPVVAAVDEFAPDFGEAFDTESAWGPAKQILTELSRRGVDLTDQEEVERAMSQLNAERLADRLRED
jgi:hypothetical protein